MKLSEKIAAEGVVPPELARYGGPAGDVAAALAWLDAQGTSVGTKNLGTTAAEVVAQQIDWIRTAAGKRFAHLVLQAGVWDVYITDDRRRGAEEVAARLASWPSTIVSNPPTAEHILASPQFLVGTVEQIVADLQEYRERYGISYFTVFGRSADAFNPIVARLAGT